MPLFQRAPATPEEMEASRPLDLSPDEVNELDEEAWYEKAYRGEAPQLTLRAVSTGAALGLVLASTNLYLGLKTGLHLGAGLTACVLSFSLWSFFCRAGWARTPMTILENTSMVSTASAASFATGNTLTSAVPALLLLSVTAAQPAGVPLPWPITATWVFLLAVLGTCLAVPMKRSLINQERLRFPSGTAVAGLLRSFHGEGARALAQSRGLFYAALAAGVVPVLKELLIVKSLGAGGKVVRAALLPASLKVFDWLPGIAGGGKVYPLSAWKVQLDYSPYLLAAGALVGLRVALSMVAGALLQILVIGPMALASTWTNPAGALVTAATGPGSIGRDIGVWVGAPILISSAVLSFAFQWRSVLRAFRGLRRSAGPYRAAPGPPAPPGARDPASVEVPTSWFAIGGGISGAGVVFLTWRWFGVPIPYGVLALVLTFALSLVVCRVEGETDITPTGAMGKIMQLLYGGLIPQNAPANLMTAGVTVGASIASAELLTDLKSGYLLGAGPRRQFVAQLLGVLPGTVATVLCYSVLVPDAAALSDAPGHPAAFTVPGALPWLAVARVFKEGIANLHPMAQHGIAWGLAAGALLTVIERVLPAQKKYLPSPIGVGLGMFLLPSQVLAIALGAGAAAIASRRKGSRAAEMVLPVASGLIAGEALVGVAVAMVNTLVLR
jgi:uncharacterized oligopeptide transporter (OPT) family protein